MIPIRVKTSHTVAIIVVNFLVKHGEKIWNVAKEILSFVAKHSEICCGSVIEHTAKWPILYARIFQSIGNEKSSMFQKYKILVCKV